MEALLAAQGARVLVAPDSTLVRVPRWASPWALHSFAKLKALSLLQFEQVLVLDSDCVALRNVDHLLQRSSPAPAFVFRHKCFPNLELSASVMVLRPDASAAARVRAMLERDDGREPAVLDDASEQCVWRRLYEEVHELPVTYNAFKSTVLVEADWRRVHVLHDANLLRKGGWRRENAHLIPWLANLTDAAKALVATADERVRAESVAATSTGHGGRNGSRKPRKIRFSEVPIYI